MSGPVRIGNAHGFWGDRLEAAAEMLALEPDLDFLTLDFLAEVSMSILALARSRDPSAGWPGDFARIVRSIAPYWRGGGRCRIITNAGGLDPNACARACREILHREGCADRAIAVVSGDDVLAPLRAADPADERFCNLDTGEPLARVRDRLVTANAYLGARPIAEALAAGADLVIAGRVADPSLTVAACADRFGWAWDDWDRLAGATVAGHLIECGAQVTGGLATDWLEMPAVERIGFPIAEIDRDGNCTITKPAGTGGCVSPRTVKEQLVYEIGDPDAYLSPDATVSLLGLRVEDEGGDRVRVRGARGRPAPACYKVSATWQDGFRAQGELTVYGRDAAAKASRAGRAVLARLGGEGVTLRESLVECLGAGACRPQGIDRESAGRLREAVLRIAVADDSREAVERFARALVPLVTAGPPGTTGYAEGRPRVRPLFRFWPCLIDRARVRPESVLLPKGDGVLQANGEREASAPWSSAAQPPLPTPSADRPREADLAGSGKPGEQADHRGTGAPRSPVGRRLFDIAHGRSGDKGIHANVGLIARRPEDFARLCREATPARVAAYFGMADASRVIRYELPNLAALNFVLRGILDNPLRADPQGKALAQVLLEMPLASPLAAQPP